MSVADYGLGAWPTAWDCLLFVTALGRCSEVLLQQIKELLQSTEERLQGPCDVVRFVFLEKSF